MITYGTYKSKAAWKCYSRANDVDFDVSNEISKQIGEYEEALKHTEDEKEKELLNVEDYVDEKYHVMLRESYAYAGIIDNVSPSPCSFLLLNQDIREEIGITRIKDVLVANITGKQADDFKYLKNDILLVSTVLVTDLVCKRIGIKQPSVRALIEKTKNRKDIFDKIYAEGNTMVRLWSLCSVMNIDN